MAQVLLVDDHPPNLLSLEAILEPLGHRLVTAGSGDEALRQLLHEDFAVILLDVQMAGLDGFQTASLIKKRERSRHTPIIFLTAHADDPSRVHSGYAHGAVDYLIKPFAPEVLRSKVRVFVELFELREALRKKAGLLETREEELRQALQMTTSDNARLGEDVRRAAAQQTRRNAQQRAVADAAVSIMSAEAGDPVLRVVAERALAIVGARRAAVALSPDRSSSRGACVVVEEEREGASPRPDELALLREIAKSHKARRQGHVYGVPLVRRDGKALGALAVETARPEIGEEDAAILVQIAQLGALVLENARLSAHIEQERNRLHEIFVRVPAIVGVVQAPDMRFVLANPKLRELAGDRPLLGETVRGASGASLGLAPIELIERAFETGEPESVRELRASRKDGEAGAFDVVYQPMLTPDGDVEAVMIFAVDVTEQVEARSRAYALAAELSQSEARFRMLLDSTAEGIFGIDPEGRCTFANAACVRLLGVPSPEALVGSSVHEVLCHEGPGKDCRIVGVVRDGAVADVWDEVFRRQDGTSFPVRYRAAPIERGGVIVGAVVTFEDITAQRQAAEEREKLIGALERSNRELDQFAYVASHDLKAPLRGIANLSEWLEEDLGERATPEAREQLALLRGRVHRMEGLINGILDYSRAGRARAKVERIEVGRLVSEVVELLAPAPGAEILVEENMPTLEAMRVPLQQVFMNLISNALKHAGERARIVVSAREDGGRYEFSVRDNGPGIAPEYQERIWGIFQTLEPRDKVEGTGIGLAVVRKIVEGRAGRAWVESNEGEGSSFKFTWPKREENREETS